MSGAILQRIAERSRAATISGIWGFLAPVAGVRNLPYSGSAGVHALIGEFPPEELEASRVLICRQDGQFELNPILAGGSSIGLFLRRTKDEAPFDIVNQNGSLTTSVPPAFGCGRDYFTKRFSGDTKSVLVAFSDDDLVILRMLSLPCTPSAGLAMMNGDQVRNFFGDATGLLNDSSSQGQTVDVVSGNYRLVLTGWSVSEPKNELPGGVASVVQRLLKVEDAFGIDTSRRVGIWRPTAREFSRIRSAAEFQDRSLVRNLIWRSVTCSTRSLRHFEKEAANRSATDYDAARRELLRTISRARELGFQSSEIAKRLEAFNRSFDQNVVDAIIRDAMSASDSVDRALLLAASELMGHWHKSSTLVRSTQDGVSGRYQPREEPLRPEELKERLRVVDGLVKIHRELTRNK